MLAFLLQIPQFASAITAYATHQPVDIKSTWHAVMLAVVAAGIASAKAHDVHSTSSEVAAATAPPDVPKK